MKYGYVFIDQTYALSPLTQRSVGRYPRHVVEWAYDNRWAVEEARSSICDEGGYALTHLIEG